MTHTGKPAEGVVAIGASAGGIEALTELASTLPPDFPYAVMVAVHISRGAPSVLDKIIDRSGPLPAVAAADGAVLEAGRIYVAVPDHHLLAHHQRVVLSDGPWESGRRPAIDALFRSVALDYGQRAIGVLLSGLLDDGVAGLRAIKAKGGITVVQDPDDASFPDLPRNAVRAGVADHAVAAKEIGGLLDELAHRELDELGADPDGRLDVENQIAMGARFAAPIAIDELGPPTGYTCPNCKGTLMAVGENTYRCQVGHGWTTQALLCAHDDELEEMVGAAIRVLKQKATLSRELAEKAGAGTDFERYSTSAKWAEAALSALGSGLATQASATTEHN